jgi:hypothetical protein
VKFSSNGWEMEPYLREDRNGTKTNARFGVKFAREVLPPREAKLGGGDAKVAGLKLGGDYSLYAMQPRVDFDMAIDGGHTGATTLVLHGFDEMALEVWAGVQNGLGDNQRARIEVPNEIAWQIPPALTAGLPLVLQLKFKVFVETGMSGRNSTLTAKGRWGLEGPMGLDHGRLLVPRLTVRDSMVESIDGVSFSVNGLVIAAEFRAFVGLGTPAAMAGGYLKVQASSGLWRSSDLAAPIQVCKGHAYKVDVGVGAGMVVSFPAPSWKALERLAGGKPIKTELELAETMGTVWNNTATLPDTPACRNR